MLGLLRHKSSAKGGGVPYHKAESSCVDLGRGLSFCISNEFPVDPAGWPADLGEARFLGLRWAAF